MNLRFQHLGDATKGAGAMDSGTDPVTTSTDQEPVVTYYTDEGRTVPPTGQKGGGGNKTSIRIGAVIALALLAGFVAWIVIDRTGNDSASTATTAATTTTPSTTGPAGTQNPIGPTVVNPIALSALVGTLGHPVYWAGPISGRTYEYTLTSSGRAYVRYLPKGVKAGDTRSRFLIVVTYPFLNAYAALKQVAKGNEVKIPGGGIALVDAGYPQSVHFAFPGVDYQGEVYDPSPKKSLAVATSGDIQPIP